MNGDGDETVYLSLCVAHCYIATVFYSHDYVATATHFGFLTIYETGSLSMRHQCKHNVRTVVV